MNIQIYIGKKNFDTQKTERYFRERRIPYQSFDLKKHKLGEKEIQLMMNALGIDGILDREDKKVKEHPACYYDRDELLIPAIMENPWLLKTPVVRNGNKITAGYQPSVWKEWV